MNESARLALFTRDLQAVMDAPDGILIFSIKGDADTFVQFSQHAGEPLYVEVASHAWGGIAPPLDNTQIARLTMLGYDIPSPLRNANPNKQYQGSAEEMAREVEQIFRDVFELAENYDGESSGVFQ